MTNIIETLYLVFKLKSYLSKIFPIFENNKLDFITKYFYKSL